MRCVACHGEGEITFDRLDYLPHEDSLYGVVGSRRGNGAHASPGGRGGECWRRASDKATGNHAWRRGAGKQGAAGYEGSAAVTDRRGGLRPSERCGGGAREEWLLRCEIAAQASGTLATHAKMRLSVVESQCHGASQPIEVAWCGPQLRMRRCQA